MIVANRVISQFARNRDICPRDFFLVRDYANRILIATEDNSKIAIIMLNMISGANDYETEIPRLIQELKTLGYGILSIVRLTKEYENKEMLFLADSL